MLFGILRPADINGLFDRWSKSGSTEYNLSLLIAASVLCWSLWVTKNKIVFYKCKPIFFAGNVSRNLLTLPVDTATTA